MNASHLETELFGFDKRKKYIYFEETWSSRFHTNAILCISTLVSEIHKVYKGNWHICLYVPISFINLSDVMIEWTKVRHFEIFLLLQSENML